MSDNLELRRNWRTNWLSSIQEFADDETQRRSWLDTTNTNPHFSFIEYFCCYFDDLGLSDGGYEWAVKEDLLTEEEVAAVAGFHNIADAYDSPTDDYDHQAIGDRMSNQSCIASPPASIPATEKQKAAVSAVL